MVMQDHGAHWSELSVERKQAYAVRAFDMARKKAEDAYENIMELQTKIDIVEMRGLMEQEERNP